MNTDLYVAICEDCPADAEKLTAIIENSSIPARCRVFSCGEDLLENFRPGQYDLILTDIYMDGMTGIETVTRIRELDADIPVAFITSSVEFALESYRLSALRYIEKPYEKKAVEDILHLADLERQSAAALEIEKNGQKERVPLAQIMYLEQQGRQVTISLSGGYKIEVYDKLSQLKEQLTDERFYFPHKSYGVNLSFVRGINKDLRCFVMKDGQNIAIRRESMNEAAQALEEFLFACSRKDTP